ncbi:uncharacterized protein DSM5745_08747 [Aspergillus mulundensis]|uniref:Amino acid permease/ SLC12A domain-containing protein n=1 Tax=Aspergillus mulundensis TaxID=1810919 RepID=A0A3D8R4S9_9EURO|nr:Uncharacterized protein DSM5745_08747 [Aspergillus mulundensis]RDW68987.1 Uncharacterized protein DSM5745_08747 [Aspergillus mulundensis]
MANEVLKQPATGIEPKAEADIERVATSSSEQNGSSMQIDPDNVGYHRSLTRRKVMMMTFGAGIGTGLWVGTGQALHYAGPAGLAVTYTLTAMIVYAQYSSIGEMTTYLPLHGGFIRQCAEFVDPAFGFAIGINFWFAWVMIIPAEITAAVSVLQFWPSTNAIPLAAYITIFLVAMGLANVFHVKIYGYIEYYMSFIKCAAVVLMIFFLFIMTSGGIPATHGPIIFTYWKNPGAFNNGIKGIAKSFVQAAFSFGGGEHIAVIAGEVASPRSTIRKTVRPVFWRMFTFFVLNIWLVGMCVPYDDPDLVNGSGTLGSPFVIALKRADVWGLAHAINGFIFLSVISCGITSVYVASRSLTALSDLGIIHGAFGRKDAAGRPWVAIANSLAIGGGLCYLNVDGTGVIVYGWFSSLVCTSPPSPQKGPGSNVRMNAGRNRNALPMGIHLHRAPAVPERPSCPREEPCRSPLQGPVDPVRAVLQSADRAVYFRWWFKTKIVKPSEMDFSAAVVFDEMERIDEMAAMEEKERDGKKSWVKRAQYLIFG